MRYANWRRVSLLWRVGHLAASRGSFFVDLRDGRRHWPDEHLQPRAAVVLRPLAGGTGVAAGHAAPAAVGRVARRAGEREPRDRQPAGFRVGGRPGSAPVVQGPADRQRCAELVGGARPVGVGWGDHGRDASPRDPTRGQRPRPERNPCTRTRQPRPPDPAVARGQPVDRSDSGRTRRAHQPHLAGAVGQRVVRSHSRRTRRTHEPDHTVTVTETDWTVPFRKDCAIFRI